MPNTMSCDGTARGKPCAGERMLRELSISTDASTCDSGDSGMCTAIYYLTKSKPGAKGEGRVFGSTEDVILALEAGEVELLTPIRLRYTGEVIDLTTAYDNQDVTHTEPVKMERQFIQTTVGRVIFNSHLPEKFPFVNGLLKKKGVQQLVYYAYLRFGLTDTVVLLDHLKARLDGQALGGGHRDAHHFQLPRRPHRAGILHLHARRAQRSCRHGPEDRRLRLSDAPSRGRCARRDHQRTRLRHQRRHLRRAYYRSGWRGRASARPRRRRRFCRQHQRLRGQRHRRRKSGNQRRA